jgi:hypothetical protein
LGGFDVEGGLPIKMTQSKDSRRSKSNVEDGRTRTRIAIQRHVPLPSLMSNAKCFHNHYL